MNRGNETSCRKSALRATVFVCMLIGLNFFSAIYVVAQDSNDPAQKRIEQNRKKSLANEGAVLTSDQAAKPELMLKREKWKPVIWFISGAAVALMVMYYTVRIFYRPTAKK
jgi:hypothetical protein